MPVKIYLEEKVLRQLYEVEKLSERKIAKILGVGYRVVSRWITDYGITRRARWIDLTGKRFGRLVALYMDGTKRIGSMVWVCRCDCGNSVRVTHCNLSNDSTQSCGCLRREWLRQASGRQMICGEIPKSYWTDICSGARSRGFPVTVTPEEVWRLFLDQGRKCALSGLPIYFAISSNSPNTASLDRIDSSLGYVLGNVQWLHKDVNKMKWSYSQDYIIELCKLVAENNSGNTTENCLCE